MTLVCDTAFIEQLSATQNANHTETLFKVLCFTYKNCMGIIKEKCFSRGATIRDTLFHYEKQSPTHCL